MSLPGDRIYLFDTSVWIRAKHPLIAPDWEAAMRNDQLAVSPIVAFEIFYGAQNQAYFETLESYLDALRQASLTPGIIRDARRALHDLPAKASHRIPFQDALIAATAAHKHMTVLHYDGHFDLLDAFNQKGEMSLVSARLGSYGPQHQSELNACDCVVGGG